MREKQSCSKHEINHPLADEGRSETGAQTLHCKEQAQHDFQRTAEGWHPHPSVSLAIKRVMTLYIYSGH